jgi:hypothetical protein
MPGAAQLPVRQRMHDDVELVAEVEAAVLDRVQEGVAADEPCGVLAHVVANEHMQGHASTSKRSQMAAISARLRSPSSSMSMIQRVAFR